MCQMVKINTLFSIENELSFLTFCLCAYHVVMKLDMHLWERSIRSYIFWEKKTLWNITYFNCAKKILVFSRVCVYFLKIAIHINGNTGKLFIVMPLSLTYMAAILFGLLQSKIEARWEFVINLFSQYLVLILFYNV